MAKTGSITFSYTQNTANNQSTVTVSGIIKTTGESYRGDSRTGTYTVKKGSTTLANNRSFTHGAPANSTTTLFSETFIIPHDDEGKCETITASYNYDSGWCSASGSLLLPTIARKSTLSVANGTLGTAQTLTISEKASAFNHKLSYKCGSASGYILGSASTTSSILSTNWTPPIDLATQNTTGTSVSITFTLDTYSGSTLIGSNTYTKTFAIPEELSDGTKVAPSCTITVSDYTGYASKYGGYIKNRSRLNVSITETKSYGSAINTYNTTANGTTYKEASFVTDLLKTAGNMTITSTVTDKRGRSGSDTETVNVLDYSAPAVTYLSVHRCNADGTENEQGEYVKATFSARVTSLGGLNSASYAIEHRKTTEAEREPVPLPISGYSVENHEYIFAAEPEASYNVKVYAMDDFDQEHGTLSTTVSTARTLLDFYGDRAMAVGKVCEVDEGFEIGLPTFIRDGCPMNVHYGKPNQYDLIAKVDALEGGAFVEKTKAEYKELSDAGLVNPETLYFIKDAESTPYNAKMVEYNNSTSGLNATKVQGAIDSVVASMPIMQRGGLAVNLPTGQASANYTVTFPKAFSSAPLVFLQLNTMTNTYANICEVRVTSVSTTEFSFRVWRHENITTSNPEPYVYWVAIQ